MRIHTEEPIEGLRHPNSIHNTADNEGLLKFSAVGKTKSNWTIEKWNVKCMKIYFGRHLMKVQTFFFGSE